MTDEEILNIDVRSLQLKPARIQDDELNDLQYDPHLQEEWLRQLAKLPGGQAITFMENGKLYVDIIAKLKGPEYEEPKGITYLNRIGGHIITGCIEVDQIPAIRRQVESLKAATEIHLHLYNSLPAIHCDSESLGVPEFLGLDGKGVIVGVVDFGCDFRHRNFRDAKGDTRLLYLWDQTKDAPKALQPKHYRYGRELTAKMINEALKAPEEEVYEKLDYTPVLSAHGTHVLDIAAGNGRESNLFGGRQGLEPVQPSHPGVAPKADLIFVHLKTFDGSLLANSSCLLDAVDYIFKKAEELGKPSVVNLSLSTSGGPHDGSTLVEEGFAAMVNACPGRSIVISAGNSSLKEGHISGTIKEGEPNAILWHTDPRYADPETTKNEMEVWYPGNRDLQISLTAPNGKPLGTVNPGETYELYAGDLRVGRISNRVQDPNNKDNQIDIRLPHLVKIPGPWKIELSSLKRNVDFHAWIEQDDHGLSRFEGPTDSQCTLGAISCSDATVTVGAFDTSEMATLALPFEVGSAGPTRPRNGGTEVRQKPDLSAPGVNIVAARAGKGTTVKSGTSMATAHVTGLIALLYDLAQRSGRDRLKYAELHEILLAAASNDPDFDDWNPRLGVGKIDGVRFIESLLAPHSVSMKVEPALLPALRQAILSMSNEVSTAADPAVKQAVDGNGYLKDMEKMRQLVTARIDKNKDVTILLD
jgi:subtilisin family serine protease